MFPKGLLSFVLEMVAETMVEIAA